jgi:DNA-binding response OmpR family regulator
VSAKKTVIFIVESDPQSLRLLTRCLDSEGYVVTPVKDEQQLFGALANKEPDLILLDMNSSEPHDFEFCQHIRSFSLVPIIVLSTQRQEDIKARVLDSGADEYVTKPFSVIEFLARVRALLRRTQWNTIEQVRMLRPMLTFNNLVVDFLQHQVMVDGRQIALTPIEYRLLSYLAQNAGRIVTHNLLLENIWGRGYSGETNLLKAHINRLRHKIEPDPARPRYIITKTGLGYLFSSQPARCQPKTETFSQEASGKDSKSVRV